MGSIKKKIRSVGFRTIKRKLNGLNSRFRDRRFTNKRQREQRKVTCTGSLYDCMCVPVDRWISVDDRCMDKGIRKLDSIGSTYRSEFYLLTVATRTNPQFQISN
jgi:hypothetical protein